MITEDTALRLEALALKIYDTDKKTGLTGPSADIDAELASLIQEPMKTIEGRDLALGYKYTLNVTNALQLRAKKWYLHITELDSTSFFPVIASFEYHPKPGFMTAGANHYGGTLGLATCAAICGTWAQIIRLWLAGSYPSVSA